MTFVDLLSELTLEEKVTLLSGSDFTTIAGIERLGISPLNVSDSISGIRPSNFNEGMTTACFPNAACYGATWDTELMGQLGEELARQARLKSSQIVLGPNINMHRDPRGGRNFECFSEDPLLSGQLAAAIVKGIQRGGVAACAKHFACNEAETLRHYYDVQEKINGRTLREIYLAAWQHMLRIAQPEIIMAAYNKVDSQHCSEHRELIQTVLRGNWVYQGAVMSDWFAVRSTVESVKAGLDVEMPFPFYRNGKLLAAVKAGELTENEIDERALKMLELRDRIVGCHGSALERSEIMEETNELAWKLACAGIVLLKNEGNALPIGSAGKTAGIALIGEFAQHPVFTGGGSASCIPQYRKSPLEILQERFAGSLSVRFAPGVRTRRIIPEVPSDRMASSNDRQGVDIAFYNDNSNEPALEEFSEKPSVWMLGRFKPELHVPGSSVQISTKLTPKTGGRHTLAVRCTGAFRLQVNAVDVLSGTAAEITTEQFIFNHILLETRVELPMEAANTYNVTLFMKGPAELTIGEPTPYAATLCFEEAYSEEAAITEAATLARESDISIVYAGRSDQFESEGFDLVDIQMPANQERLIRAVAAASRHTVLVLHCGNPMDVSAFVDDVDAILLAHFPGQEGARATIDILTGLVCPSGRLATTWFKTLEHAPSFSNFPPKKSGESQDAVTVKYSEGIQVGYRHPEGHERVRWPFGHGLSYTSWSYTDLHVIVEESSSLPKLLVSVNVQNSGSLAGKTVVQLFIKPKKVSCGGIWRPQQELKAFDKVYLQPWENATVRLEIDLKMACSYWDELERSWRIESGTYGVQVAGLEAQFVVGQEGLWNHL